MSAFETKRTCHACSRMSAFQVCSREVTPGAVRSKPSFARLNRISSLANCPNCDEGAEFGPIMACPSEHLERVFKSFYTTKSSGTGMGCRFAGLSSTPMGAGCGQRRTNLGAPYFSSLCPPSREPDVRYWHLADTASALQNIRHRGKRMRPMRLSSRRCARRCASPPTIAAVATNKLWSPRVLG